MCQCQPLQPQHCWKGGIYEDSFLFADIVLYTFITCTPVFFTCVGLEANIHHTGALFLILYQSSASFLVQRTNLNPKKLN